MSMLSIFSVNSTDTASLPSEPKTLRRDALRIKLIMKRLVSILIFSLILLPLAAREYSPSEVPNVNVGNRYEFVSDPESLLDPAVKEKVNKRLWDLRQETSVEAAVVIVPSTGDMTIEDFSNEIFDSWKIGKSDKDNGLLFVIAPDDRRVRIQTGYGLEGVMPDIVCDNIIGRDVVPNMQMGNLGDAVDAATSDISSVITDPAFREELKSSHLDNYQGDIEALSLDVFMEFLGIVAVIGFLFALAIFCYDLWNSRKRPPYERALLWRSRLSVLAWASVFSIGAALPFLLLAYFLYRSARDRRLRCDTCGAKMNKLPEDKDNELLSASQDFEERLHTVDYDVWECPKCGTIERFPFKERQTKYSECPHCHTVAMHLKQDNIIVSPTTTREGRGERIYECEFCHHQRREPYRLPKKDSEAAALAAGAVLGSMAGHRGGGGGFGGGGFGGGFGGGSSGGGGASGSW